MDWIDNRLTIYSDQENDLTEFLRLMSGPDVMVSWGTPEQVAHKIRENILQGMTPREAVLNTCGFEYSVRALKADQPGNVTSWLEGLQSQIETLERDCSPVFGSPGDKPFSFMRGYPIPAEIRKAGKALGGTPWSIENWGTRYDAIKPELNEAGWREGVGGYVGVISFITVDNAPNAFINYIASKYRKLIFSLVSCDYLGRQSWGSVAYQDDSMDFSNVVGRFKDNMIVEIDGEFTMDSREIDRHSGSMAKAIRGNTKPRK